MVALEMIGGKEFHREGEELVQFDQFNIDGKIRAVATERGLSQAY